MVDDCNPENLLGCTLYGKFQVTTANSITGLGDKPQIFDCGIYNVLGEAAIPMYWQGVWPPVGSFGFFTPDGAWDPECVSPTGGDECANQQCTYEKTAQTAKGCASCCGGVLRHKETCYTLYDGVVLNPTDKAECE